MIFSSPLFIFWFLPYLLLAYALVPMALRNILLLAASLLFYAWGEGLYALVMILSIVMNYGFALAVEGLRSQGRPEPQVKGIVAAAVASNLALLAFFKYAGFLTDNLNTLLTASGASPWPKPTIHLPIGISFFTFHALSYVIDVYRRQARAQRSLTDLALYIAFFPQLIAGPIIRYHDVASQLRERRSTCAGVAYGIRRFIIGLAKKALVANTVGLVADKIFALPPTELTTPLSWLAITAYTLQIYFDFSAYSDMAIGLARVFGFHFLENFNYPYISRDIREFWRRWHISLSNWFRDYLYIPLGGNRGSKLRTYCNLLTVFFLCGLWHGASWNFLVWGLYHGSFLVLERSSVGQLIERWPRALRHAYALIVVMVGWVFFRADNMTQAWLFLKAMAFGLPRPLASLDTYLSNDVLLAIAVGMVGSTPLLPSLGRWWARVEAGFRGRRWEQSAAWGVATVSLGACVVLFGAALMSIASGVYNPFIYFRF